MDGTPTAPSFVAAVHAGGSQGGGVRGEAAAGDVERARADPGADRAADDHRVRRGVGVGPGHHEAVADEGTVAGGPGVGRAAVVEDEDGSAVEHAVVAAAQVDADRVAPEHGAGEDHIQAVVRDRACQSEHV